MGFAFEGNNDWVLCYLVDDSGLVDVGFLDPQFTWNKGIFFKNFVGAHMDRGLFTIDWRMKFSEASITHLPRAHSDHYPIMLNTCSDAGTHNRMNRFFVQSAWFLHYSFSQWFAKNWSQERVSMVKKKGHLRIRKDL